MPLMGNLSQFALPTVLRSVESEQRTGRLRLAYGEQEGAIYFTGGQWALLSRPGGDTPLAQQFLRARLVTPEDFERATGVPVAMAQTLTDSQTVGMLVRDGALRMDQIRAWAVDDAITMLATAFNWPDGEFLFEDGAVIPAGRVATLLSVSSLIEQAQIKARESTAGRGSTPPPLSPEMVIDFAEVDPNGDLVRISRDHWRLLTYVDGRTSLLGIAQRMGEQEVPILHLASQLAAGGIVLVVGRAG